MEASISAAHKSTSNTSMNEELVLVEESLDFSSPQHFSDVVLVVEDAKFHVHKSTLSMWSPVFEAMFTHQFKESTAKEIPLPGKRADEVKKLLKVIYSSWSKPKVTEENYQFLLQLADEYQMDRVKKLCCEFLNNKIEESNCLEYFKLAEKFGLDGITEKCHQEVRYTSSDDLEGSEHFNGFEPELKVDICMKIIKELERTLQEYVKTCSCLIEEVYGKVYGFPSSIFRMFSIQKHIYQHGLKQNNLQKALAKAATSKERSMIDPDDYREIPFCFSCEYCTRRVHELEWDNNDSYSILKGPLNKLFALQQNNKVARKAKKRAVKLAEKLGTPNLDSYEDF